MGSLAFCILIAVFKGFSSFIGGLDYKNFITVYLGIPLYVIMIVGYKLIVKSERVLPETAGMKGGKQRMDDEEAEFVAAELEKYGLPDGDTVTETVSEHDWRGVLISLILDATRLCGGREAGRKGVRVRVFL